MPPAAADSTAGAQTIDSSATRVLDSAFADASAAATAVPVPAAAAATANNIADASSDVSSVSGPSAVAANGEEASVEVSENPSLNAEFSTKRPTIRRFRNHNEAKFDEGFDSDGEHMHYDPVSLENDPNAYEEAVVDDVVAAVWRFCLVVV